MRALLKSPALWMILPSFALTMFVIGYPILDLAWTSLQEVSRFGKLLGFAGTMNYGELVGDQLFIDSLVRTGIWTACVVTGAIVISLPVALILNEDFIGRGVARIIIMLPWSISLTMTAVVWRWALNGRAGLFNATFMNLGWMQEPVEWLATAQLGFTVEIMVGILVSIPFTTTIFLGGLSSMPQDVYEAAYVDGASRWQQFRHITLPLLKPFMNIAIVLNVIYVFNSFPIIWVMTEGGPANGTDILVTYLYKLAFRFGQLGKASAISLAMFFILFAFTLLYVWLVMRGEGETGADSDEPAPEEEGAPA